MNLTLLFEREGNFLCGTEEGFLVVLRTQNAEDNIRLRKSLDLPNLAGKGADLSEFTSHEVVWLQDRKRVCMVRVKYDRWAGIWTVAGEAARDLRGEIRKRRGARDQKGAER